jgi:HEAT repeat protein
MEINEEIRAAKDVIQAILKSKKILRMYPSNNPIYFKTLEDANSKFREFFYYNDELQLKIKQNEIYCGSEQVYSSSEKEDNLALFFFKDGLRELTFRKGLTNDEMEAFLTVITLDFDTEVIDDDIVTLFWEKDFQNIQYVVDEIVLGVEEDYETPAVNKAKEETNEPNNLMKAYEDALKESDTIKESSIIPLTDQDLHALLEEFEKDTKEKLGKLVYILFEMMYLADTRQDFEDISVFLMNSVDYAVLHGDINIATDILLRLKDLLEDKNISEEIKKYIKKILSFAGSEPVLIHLGELLDSGQDIDEKTFVAFVNFLDKNAIIPFMKMLGELKSIHARKLVIDALTYLGPKDISLLASGLNDARWYVVRNIIYILRKIADKRAVDFLLKTVKHGDIRVKKEVIRALGELGGPGVIVALRDSLDDPEVQVRIAVLKALGNIGSEAAKRIILDRIIDKKFKDKEFDEKKDYFEIISKWKDKEIFDFLVQTLKRKTFFGSTKNDENRACAAYSLGLLGNKDALNILNKYKNDGSKLIKEFTFTSIRKLEHER